MSVIEQGKFVSHRKLTLRLMRGQSKMTQRTPECATEGKYVGALLFRHVRDQCCRPGWDAYRA